MARRRRLTEAEKRKRWRRVGIGALWAVAGVSAWELYLATVLRKQRLRDTFNLALRRKQETGKPLLVVGDPRGRFLARTLGVDWDCADGCIGFESLPTMSADSAVIYSALELEKAADPRAAAREMQRVSGGDLFVVSTEPYSLLSFLPNRRSRVLSAPPTTPYIEWRALPWEAGPSTVERLGRAA